MKRDFIDKEHVWAAAEGEAQRGHRAPSFNQVLLDEKSDCAGMLQV